MSGSKCFSVNELKKLAIGQGFTLKTGTRHMKWFCPKGRLVAISALGKQRTMPASHHARNLQADLKRAGLLLPS